MEMSKCSLDLLLVPLSIFINASYHVYLWYRSKSKHPKTTIGANIAKQRRWLQNIMQGDDKKGMLGIQSFRNSLMSVILSATIAVIINTALAALTNNVYSSSHLLAGHAAFGSQGGDMLVLKYASASLLLLFSFLCSSMAVGCIIEASFLINANASEIFIVHVEEVLRKGSVLAIVGNRALYVGITLLMWMFGPISLALSTVGMVWVFYNLDFHSTCLKKP